MLRLDLYEVLGISPYRLELRADELEKNFYELSRRWHPDRNSGNLDAVEVSARINNAYRRLKDPWQRAEYVLEALGERLGSKVPPRLASIFFELQEAESPEALRECEAQLSAGQEAIELALKKSFEIWDAREPKDWASLEFSAQRGALVNLILERNYTKTMLHDIKSRLSKKT